AAALRRLRRVLTPGALIGIADADYGGSIAWPSTPGLRRAERLALRIRRFSGGDVHVGRKLVAHLAEVGFVDIRGGATAFVASPAEGQWQSAYFASPELQAHLIATGIASRAEATEASDAWARWAASPGAYWARFWCHAIATNPGGVETFPDDEARATSAAIQ
ncbi:MAG: hypothetical protein ABIP13_08320, partial [Tepidiformaceae bacterium]